MPRAADGRCGHVGRSLAEALVVVGTLLLVAPSTFRRCNGASSGTMTSSS
jgi:hypothetical protein